VDAGAAVVGLDVSLAAWPRPGRLLNRPQKITPQVDNDDIGGIGGCDYIEGESRYAGDA
jgi:hypothetical protein